MPYTTIVAGTYATASWANANVRDQVITTFASTTARDSNITVPVEGMVCFIGSNDANEGLYVYHGATGGWRKGPGWNAPWGVMSYVQTTTSQLSITTRIAATGMTTGSVTYVANRLLRVTVLTPKMSSTLANTRIETFLVNGSTTVASCTSVSPTAGVGMATGLSFYETTTAGARTYLLEIGRNDASTVQTNAASTNPFQLIVEDIGPSGAPA